MTSGRAARRMQVSPIGWHFLGLALPFIVFFFVLLVRQDRERSRRPHPGPEQGGNSFGDTTHWGGMGRPGS